MNPLLARHRRDGVVVVVTLERSCEAVVAVLVVARKAAHACGRGGPFLHYPPVFVFSFHFRYRIHIVHIVCPLDGIRGEHF